MDYWWSLAAFAVGYLAGLLGVRDKYSQDMAVAGMHPMSVVYCLTRGALPAAVFCWYVGTKSDALGPPLMAALVLGVGAEAVVRTQFFLGKFSGSSSAELKDVYAGPFDLLRRYQGWFLDVVGTAVTESRAQWVKGFKGFSSLTEMGSHVLTRVGALDSADLQAKAREALDSYMAKAVPAPAGSAEDRNQQIQLGFVLRGLVGPAKFNSLIS